jgi:hypothetical protein
MVTRRFAVAIGVLAGALLLAAYGAQARVGGFGGHGFAAHGHVGHGIRPHAFALRHRALHRLHARRHERGLDLWPWGYGSFDPVYGVSDDDIAARNIDPRLLALMLNRPSCRLQTQSLTVATDFGSERRVAITRCLLPIGMPALPSGPTLKVFASEGEPEVTGSLAAAAEGPPADGRVCRIETRNVPAEDGGRRTITIHRC